MKIWVAAIVSAAVLAGCDGKPTPPPAGGGTPTTPGGGGTPQQPKDGKPIDPATVGAIEGIVKCGTDPQPRGKISTPAECGHEGGSIPGERKVVNEGGAVQYAFVWISKGHEGWKYEMPNTPVTLDQKGCMYAPHALAKATSQPFQIRNSDQTKHNTNGKPTVNKTWNFMQNPAAVDPVKVDLPEGPFHVGCDIHSWMGAYVAVFDHPFFAVTGPDGKFKITGVPPGTYEVTVWQESLNNGEPVQKTQSVTVGAKETKQIEFQLK